MLKAVLFDLDDTLIDWSGFHGDWYKMEMRHLAGVFDYIRQTHPLDDLEQYGTEFRNRTMAAWADARTTMRGPNLGKVLVESAVALGVPAHALDVEGCLEAYRWGVVDGTEIFPEVVATLRELRQHGLRFGIITNAYQPMSMRDIELEAHGLAEFFPECRFSAADLGYLKPHPSVFKGALECLGVEPEEAVFVGDDPDADIVGARQVGIFAVLRGSRRTTNPMGVPDATIHSLTDLPEIFDREFPGWRR